MSKEDKTTQDEAVNTSPEKTEQESKENSNETQEVKKEESKDSEKSIGDVLNDKDEKEPPTVGLDKFLEIKKEKKELENKLAELAKRKEEGESNKDIADDIDALAEEHNIDKGFLNKLVKSIESKAEKSLEERINAKLEPITAKEREAKINEVFSKAFKETLDKNPEYKDIANADIIKTLATNPANAKKTLSQILEETYGNAITGKKTIEKTTPGGGKEPTTVDYAKAQTDSEYFKQIMANPDLKKKYNEKALEEVTRLL